MIIVNEKRSFKIDEKEFYLLYEKAVSDGVSDINPLKKYNDNYKKDKKFLKVLYRKTFQED